MITQSDIDIILYQDFSGLGMEVFSSKNAPKGKITSERIVTIVGKTSPDVLWVRTNVNIHIVIPDLDDNGLANEIRIGEVQKMLGGYASVCGSYKGENYIYERIGEEVKRGDYCHYIDLEYKFETLNLLKS